MHTIESAQQWENENAVRLDAKRLASTDEGVQMLNRILPDKSRQLWNSGCWLAEQLEACGASDDEIRDIQMVQGQHAFGGSAWQAAVDLANEYTETHTTKEHAGAELAEKLFKERFQKQ